MAISIRKPEEIEKIKEANVIVAKALNCLKDGNVKPGMSLKDIDKEVERIIVENGGRPSFKGLYGFPAAACTSVNEVIIHGIPTDYILKDGDIVGVDIGVELDGWYGDAAITLPVGLTKEEDIKLIECSKDALEYAISIIEDGMRFKELSAEIEQFIKDKGYFPLKGYCGHGIGRKPHEEPEIPNYLDGRNAKQGPKIKEGMVFCIEPMVCQKSGDSKILSDDWSVVSKDGLNGSHYEHTMAIIDKKAVVLSKE